MNEVQRGPDTGLCHDCGAHEGQLHKDGCDMERCPFCGGQLISCDCCYLKLGYSFDRNAPMCGLPEEVYKNGLLPCSVDEWNRILEKKGRVPYILYPNLCAYCGERWPKMFNVSDEEWDKYVQICERHQLLCRPCYDLIKELIDTNGQPGERGE